MASSQVHINNPGTAATAIEDAMLKEAEMIKKTLESVGAAAQEKLHEVLSSTTSNTNINTKFIATNNANLSTIPGATGGTNGGGDLITYSGPASSFPDPSQWASYTSLWTKNSQLMTFHDSASEIAQIKTGIETVARESGVDVRVILTVIMQESGGNVRVRTTISPDGSVRNPGLMQSHNGVEFDPSRPAESITQMIWDGVEGTKFGDGLRGCCDKQGGNWYRAFRMYNSGSVNGGNLSDGFGATGDYVSTIANRLMGHFWNSM